MEPTTYRIDVMFVPNAHMSHRDIPVFYIHGANTPEEALRTARDIVGDRWISTTYHVTDSAGVTRLTHTVER